MDEPEIEIHDPLAEDVARLVEMWGLATLIHGVYAHVRRQMEGTDGTALEPLADKLDAAWCEAEGGER